MHSASKNTMEEKEAKNRREASQTKTCVALPRSDATMQLSDVLKIVNYDPFRF
jgi:hypothetical protein